MEEALESFECQDINSNCNPNQRFPNQRHVNFILEEKGSQNVNSFCKLKKKKAILEVYGHLNPLKSFCKAKAKITKKTLQAPNLSDMGP